MNVLLLNRVFESFYLSVLCDKVTTMNAVAARKLDKRKTTGRQGCEKMYYSSEVTIVTRVSILLSKTKPPGSSYQSYFKFLCITLPSKGPTKLKW